jgi:hypothetical protein
MRFKVTGGKDGRAGVEIAGRRYEPGDIVDITGSKANWLVELGYLETADGKTFKVTAEPEPAPEAPATEESPAEAPTEANETETEVTE